MVTEVPTAPEVGVRLEIVGVGSTVNITPLLATPLSVTTTLPVVAPVGTSATMLVALQLETAAARPLNVTELVPCVTPKFVPAMVTEAPTAPEVGLRLVMPGVGSTVNVTPLLTTPPTVTTTLPVVAPVGTFATMLVALQLVGVAAVPLNVIVLVPCVAPKFVPAMVTEVPTGPEVGLRLVIPGVGSTVKAMPLLATPAAVTTTLPVVAPAGTDTTMLEALQLEGVASVPLNVTVLAPWVAPKFVPVIVTEVPTAPEVGLTLVMAGVGSTVNAMPLLTTPATVTTTFPVVAPVGTLATMLVALQLEAVAARPLNVTVLVPWVAPKFEPVMVTEAPTAPDVGLRLAMPGVASTVNVTPLLTTPLTVTTTLPAVAPVGTFATILVALQLVGVAAVPLKVRVLVP